jgi:hypothetical protein
MRNDATALQALLRLTLQPAVAADRALVATQRAARCLSAIPTPPSFLRAPVIVDQSICRRIDRLTEGRTCNGVRFVFSINLAQWVLVQCGSVERGQRWRGRSCQFTDVGA